MKVAETSPEKRILYAITKASWGGAQRYVFDLATGARERGHEVLVVTGSEGALTRHLEEAGIPVRTIPAMERDMRLKSEWRAFTGIRETIKEFRPDIVHGNSSKAGALSALAARTLGVSRIVFTAHAWAFNEKRHGLSRLLIALAHYLTVLLSHRTICVSEAVHEHARWMPGVQGRLRTIHNGIEPIDLYEKDTARDRLAPGFVRDFPEALWIGTIAELHYTKGLDILLRAFLKLETPAVVVIVGEGEEREQLTRLSEDLGISDRVLFTGFVQNAALYLPAFDVFAMPSRSEALGYALLEAGLASVAAIGSNVGGIPEIITDKESGMLVPREDEEALAEALELLASNEVLRTQLGSALYERVVRVFPKDRMVRETLGLYED